MKKLIILNHKMNLEYDEVIPYINTLNEINTNNNIIICPPVCWAAKECSENGQAKDRKSC